MELMYINSHSSIRYYFFIYEKRKPRKGKDAKWPVSPSEWGRKSDSTLDSFTPWTILFSADHVHFNDTIVDLSFDEGNTEIFLIKQQMKSSCNRRPHAPVHWMTDPSHDRWNVSLSSLSPIISSEIPHPITKGGGYFDLGRAFLKSALLKYSW